MKKLFAVVVVVSTLAASSAFAQYVVFGTRCVTPHVWIYIPPAPLGSSCFVATPFGPAWGSVYP